VFCRGLSPAAKVLSALATSVSNNFNGGATGSQSPPKALEDLPILFNLTGIIPKCGSLADIPSTAFYFSSCVR